MALKIVALAGGVGGAKLADGLYHVMPPADLTVVVNTADDFTHLGLRICPDLDTVLYTLAGRADPEKGWGRADESWDVLQELGRLGGPTWFKLGDKDLALHLFRAGRLQEGAALHAITAELSAAFGVNSTLLPMTNDRIGTMVDTEEGELPFQEYFVARRWVPTVRGFRFEGAQEASPAPGVLEAIEAADLAVLCPSNPWVSIDPILSVPGIRTELKDKPVIAISPLIGGKAVKGPAAKMYNDLGIHPSVLAVTRHYGGLITAIFIDQSDANHASQVQALGARPVVSEIIMRDRPDRSRLAREVLQFAANLVSGAIPA